MRRREMEREMRSQATVAIGGAEGPLWWYLGKPNQSSISTHLAFHLPSFLKIFLRRLRCHFGFTGAPLTTYCMLPAQYYRMGPPNPHPTTPHHAQSTNLCTYHLVKASCMDAVRAWPRWSDPVTFGGGKQITNFPLGFGSSTLVR